MAWYTGSVTGVRPHICWNASPYTVGPPNAWYAARVFDSFMRDQNGSHTGSAGERPPAGPGRIDTTFAPFSSTKSSSLAASSGSSIGMYGGA